MLDFSTILRVAISTQWTILKLNTERTTSKEWIGTVVGPPPQWGIKKQFRCQPEESNLSKLVTETHYNISFNKSSKQSSAQIPFSTCFHHLFQPRVWGPGSSSDSESSNSPLTFTFSWARCHLGGRVNHSGFRPTSPPRLQISVIKHWGYPKIGVRFLHILWRSMDILFMVTLTRNNASYSANKTILKSYIIYIIIYIARLAWYVNSMLILLWTVCTQS